MPILTLEVDNHSFELLVDGLPYRKVEVKLFRRNLQLPKSFDSMGQLDDWFYDLEYKLAKNYLLFLLGKQDYLSNVIKNKLTKRLISKTTQEKLLEDFIKLGYINDQKVVLQLIHKHKKKKSTAEIRQLLRREGIDLDFYPEVSKQLGIDDEKEVVEKLISKKRGKDKQKLKAYLFRRGFSVDVIRTLNDLDI